MVGILEPLKAVGLKEDVFVRNAVECWMVGPFSTGATGAEEVMRTTPLIEVIGLDWMIERYNRLILHVS